MLLFRSISSSLCIIVLLFGHHEACNKKQKEKKDEVSERLTSQPPGCYLDISDDMRKESPLLLKPTGSLDGFRFFLPPSNSDVLYFHPKQKIFLACPGKGNKFVINDRQKTYRETVAICDSDKRLSIDGVSTHFQNINCKETPESSVVKHGKCSEQTADNNIGFQLNSEFIKLMEVCHFPSDQRTFFVKYNVMKGIESRQRNVPRQNYFKKDKFYKDISPPIEDVYSCKGGQFETFKEQLGSDNLAAKYINCNIKGGSSLDKGHLAAYADFVYFPQQKATLYYIDTVPQWHYFNDGNWRVLEDRIRKYAKNKNEDLTVYAGSYDTIQLPNVNNKQQSIFLSSNSDGKPVVPVPAQMFRIVYDQSMKHGIVFVGVNSASKNETSLKDKLCNDVCDQTTSFFQGWNRKDFAKGYIYCCTLSDFFSRNNFRDEFPGVKLPLLK